MVFHMVCALKNTFPMKHAPTMQFLTDTVYTDKWNVRNKATGGELCLERKHDHSPGIFPRWNQIRSSIVMVKYNVRQCDR